MAPRSESVIGSRRGVSLLPIQTNATSSNVPPKRPPRPGDLADRDLSAGRAPSSKSQTTKSSLKSLFSRNKSSRRSNHGQTLPVIAESHKMSISIIPDPVPSPTTASSTPVTPKFPIMMPSPQLGKIDSNNSSNSSKTALEKGQKVYRTITAWDPPPLFQAYPQAIKQATLPVPSRTESILRLSSHRRNHSAKDDGSDIDADDERASMSSSKKRKDEKDKKHSRKISSSLGKAEWTQKIFILVASGFILQYAGEGSFDRLPEKMIELGKNSVAFASDAIPGKHWVLQVSEVIDEEGLVTLDSRKSLLSRLGFADSRRQTKTLLMVCKSPDEMTSWLSAVRREIESLGGKEYTPETPQEEPSQDPLEAQTRWANRQSVLSSQNQPINTPPTDVELAEPSPNVNWNTREDQRLANNRLADETSLKSSNRQSMPPRTSIEAPSLSTTGTTTDLDRLREGSRLSYVSIGTRTIPSSRGSSPGLSPATLNGTTPKPAFAESPRSVRSTAPTAATDPGSSRLSIQAYSSTQPEGSVTGTDSSSGSRPQSIVGPLATRSTSPPNFSVPRFSKRFSGSQSRPPPSSRRFNQASPPPSPRRNNPSSSNRISSLSVFEDFVPPTQLPNGHSESNSYHREIDHVRQPVPFVFDPEMPSRVPTQSKPKESNPRRYSSFESTRGRSGLSSSYHPKLPPVGNEFEEGYSSDALAQRMRPQARGEADYLSSTADAHSRSLRRPVSMQIGTEARRRGQVIQDFQPTYRDFPSPSSRPPRLNRTSLPHTGILNDIPPYHQSPATSANNRSSLHKTMSHLSLGPPVAPPPNCPLPRVPPVIASKHRPAWTEQSTDGHDAARPPSRTGPGHRRDTRTHTITPVDLRNASSSPTLNGMTPKEFSMVNAF
ncbi:hypothetical protein FQN55_008064 [Onygenales sp. PD_40]|nr:hypothetical protein FQN55_008064 [Onygenales sp. PD_40]KAK2779491.1 hypothetical protein FQN52_002424 [Onygenales sp. PD_12]KAK2790287.1 hypothetical protein FQN53_000053 [Emmonsiellopsis sp. PD_33]KAK2806604.1 hypothetical protein FQN51_006570 [Onygenales sp. PD_10]